MENKKIIIDTEKMIYEETLDLQFKSQRSTDALPIKVTKRRLQGGVQDGLDIMEVDNGRLSFTILLSRGMNLLKGRCGDVELKWDSPVNGPVHPKFVPLFAPNGCGWLEGFCEWIARCGLESNGAPEFSPNGVLKYPLHGRLSNLPARKVEIEFVPDTDTIYISGEMLEASLFGHKLLFKTIYSTQGNSAQLTVEDSVSNLASVDDEFELLYHINLGNPLVSAGAKFYGSYEKMCPRDQNAVKELDQWDVFREPIVNCPETCYFFDLATDQDGNTSVVLVNADSNKGLTLSFNKKEFPYFILWKTQRPNNDVYVTGLEPAINFPNTRSFEKSHRRVAPIKSNETRSFKFVFDILQNADEVNKGIEKVQSLKGTGLIEKSPLKEWCE